MFKQLVNRIQVQALQNSATFQFSSVAFSKGTPVYQSNTQNVQLRGCYIKGNFEDLPNLIFFSELFDPVQNWIPFFTNKNNRFLDYRNIWLVNPRNFGNSDRNNSFDIEEQANDVVRFMYQNKISTATLGGHGFGAKLALATGCFHSERVTGVFGLDSGPLDYRFYQPFQEMRNYVQRVSEINLSNTNDKDLQLQLKERVEDPKWRSIFRQNLSQINETTFKWNCEMNFINKNLQFNKADSLGAWNERNGLFTGKVCFIAPEYSRWFHLNTNTLAVLKTCPQAKGFGHDIFAIQGDENTQNHWIYDFEDQAYVAARKLLKFVTMYDGVHVLLKDRSEVGKYFIPDRINSRNNSNHVYSDYSPSHYHHNWRFNDIYERAKKNE